MFVLSKLRIPHGRLAGCRAAVPHLIRAMSQTPKSESAASITSFISSIFCDNEALEKPEADLSLFSLEKQLVEKKMITESDKDQVGV